MMIKAGTEEWCSHEQSGKDKGLRIMSGNRKPLRGVQRSTSWEGIALRQRTLNSIQKVSESTHFFFKKGVVKHSCGPHHAVADLE